MLAILKVIYPKYSKHWPYTYEFNFTTMIPQVDLFSFIFWKKLKTPKRHFEINWPLALPKTARSAQTHKSISFIWIVLSTLYAYLWPFYQNIDKIMYFLLCPKEFALFFCTCSACCCSWACMLHFSTAWIHMINCTFCYLAIVARTQWGQVSSDAEFLFSIFFDFLNAS